jgi:uncharacterized small protein (DUF1192 family)
MQHAPSSPTELLQLRKQVLQRLAEIDRAVAEKREEIRRLEAQFARMERHSRRAA